MTVFVLVIQIHCLIFVIKKFLNLKLRQDTEYHGYRYKINTYSL